jgi:bacterioferritin
MVFGYNRIPIVSWLRDKSIMFEEYAREMIYVEEMHLGEVDKMLRKPGDVGVFKI